MLRLGRDGRGSGVNDVLVAQETGWVAIVVFVIGFVAFVVSAYRQESKREEGEWLRQEATKLEARKQSLGITSDAQWWSYLREYKTAWMAYLRERDIDPSAPTLGDVADVSDFEREFDAKWKVRRGFSG
jgi:hypothetical protein